MKFLKFLDENLANPLIALGFAVATLMVVAGLWETINPPRRVVGLAGTELLIVFGPAWLYWAGWLTWTLSEKRLLNSIYPRKARFTVIGFYLLFVGAAVIVAIVG